eukprot:5483239-Amphidinium_carterae.1
MRKPNDVLSETITLVYTYFRNFDESLLLDSPHFQWLGALLGRHKGQRAANSPLFAVRYADWVKLFLQCFKEMGLEKKGSSLYQLRHSGASHELLHGLRDVTGVKKRGRWKTDKSVARYEKGGRVAEQLHLLPRCHLLSSRTAAGV